MTPKGPVMTTRTLAGRALTAAGETLRIVAFMCIAVVLLVSIAPHDTGLHLNGPAWGVLVVTLALLGVAFLATAVRDFGARLAPRTIQP